jgi:hypothetical protein
VCNACFKLYLIWHLVRKVCGVRLVLRKKEEILPLKESTDWSLQCVCVCVCAAYFLRHKVALNYYSKIFSFKGLNHDNTWQWINIFKYEAISGSQDSVVGIATGLWVGRPKGRSSSPGMVKNFLFSTSSIPALGPTKNPIQWVPGAFSLGVKRPGSKADHTPPTSAEVKKMWIYTSTPPYPFMA